MRASDMPIFLMNVSALKGLRRYCLYRTGEIILTHSRRRQPSPGAEMRHQAGKLDQVGKAEHGAAAADGDDGIRGCMIGPLRRN